MPLSNDVLAIVKALPKFRHGDYVFSFKFGTRPALILHSAKRRLDALMCSTSVRQHRTGGKTLPK